MAKKSKTQRAKASAARAARKAAREEAKLSEGASEAPEDDSAEKQSRTLFKKKAESDDDKAGVKKADAKKAVAKKEEQKPSKKKRFQFFRDVKAEMKRVTWPSRPDVLRWSGVVVVALLFFGIYVALLDNAIITPILVVVSGIGPALGIS